MIALLVATMLGAAPPVELWEKDTGQAPRSAIDSVLVVLRETLVEKELGEATTGRCGKLEDCLVKKAREAGGIAIGLSIAEGRKGLIVDLEAVSPDGTSLAAATFALPRSGDRQLPEARLFVETLAAKWRERKPARVEKVTPQREPEPVVTPRAAQVEEELELPASFWSRPPARITLIAGGVTAVAAIALGIAGGAVKGQLDSSLAASPPVLTRMQALDQAGLANGLLTGCLLSTLATAVAGAVLAIFFGVSE